MIADAALDRSLAELTRHLGSPLYCAARAISPGDEFQLTPAEHAQMQRSAPSVRRASAAARIVARQLFEKAGSSPPADICKGSHGAPIWPEGFVGSLSHDEGIAVAAISRRCHYASIGIDVEPATPLPRELLDIVATPHEISQMTDLSTEPKLLFCVKEAVYKTVNVIDGRYLDHHDVEFSFRTGLAIVVGQYQVKVSTVVSPRMLALAVIDQVPCRFTAAQK